MNEGDGADTTAEALTVAEAAARLSVSLPRLRRLLARPEWQTRTRTGTRETRTGTRTALLVPVSVLVPLAADLASVDNVIAPAENAGAPPKREREQERIQEREREQVRPEWEREREQERVAAAFALAEERRRADVAVAVAAEVRAERDRLALALSEAQATAKAALDALEREQGRASVLIAAAAQGRMIEPMARSGESSAQDNAPDRPAAFTGDTHTNDSEPQGETPGRSWFARLFGGKGTG